MTNFIDTVTMHYEVCWLSQDLSVLLLLLQSVNKAPTYFWFSLLFHRSWESNAYASNNKKVLVKHTTYIFNYKF